jgi:hypothetical protein
LAKHRPSGQAHYRPDGRCATVRDAVHYEYETKLPDRLSGVETRQLKAPNRDHRKSVVVVCIVVPIALLHFVTGSAYQGPLPDLVNGYLLDILVPSAFYLLLCLPETPRLHSWPVKAILVFGAASSVEIAQFLGMPVLGRTFDPLDFVAYGLGVGLAVVLDTVVLPRIIPSWVTEPTPAT